MTKRVAVVGGGIAGLAAAHALATEHGCETVLLEAGPRLGGKIRTSSFAGRAVDEGADAFLARVPFAVSLARAVGLGDDLVSPARGNAFVVRGDRLLALPDGLVLGVPTDLAALARSRTVSPPGVARAALDLVLPGRAQPGDESVGSLIRRRLGDEVHDRLVEPMLGGINAGRTDELSMSVAAPQLAAAAQARSLIRGLRAQRRAAAVAPDAPVFYSPASGMESLVSAVAAEIERAGGDVRLASEVVALERTGAGWTVGDQGEFDAVVLAVPAPDAAALVESHSTDAAVALRAVAYASVALVTLAYRRDHVRDRLAGSGFLVPPVEGRLLTACSFASSKWAHLAGGDTVILRASAGRSGDERALELDDQALTERIHAELAQLLGITSAPLEARVSRWPRAFPQYRPGHLDSMASAAHALSLDMPGVALAGAAVRGVGVPTCIATGREAAAHVAGVGSGERTRRR